jgi:hypothetical protein
MEKAENEAKSQERGVGFEESGDEKFVGFVGIKRGGRDDGIQKKRDTKILSNVASLFSPPFRLL